MKYKILIILLIAFIYDSCKKPESESQILFSGIVIDYDRNEPFPNQLTKMLRRKSSQQNSSIRDSTWTNSNGVFQFLVKYEERDSYYVNVKKDSYIQKPTRQWPHHKFYDETSVNVDTLIIGQAAILNILINSYSSSNEYIIECNMDIPPELFDPLADYNPNKRLIPRGFTPISFFERYLYKDNHEVFISWIEIDSLTGDTSNKNTEVIKLIPMDTTYLTIEFQ